MGRRQLGHPHEELPGSLRPAPARPRDDVTQGAGVARGAPLSAGAIAHLQRTAGNQAVGHLVVQRDKEYPYGSANSIPHIHQYGPDAHLKIMDRGKIRRIELVQNNKRYGDAVAEAFDLARASGNMTLVDAIKDVIRGTKFA